MFHLINNLGLKLTESEFFYLLQDGIPGQTSYALVTCIYDPLLFLRRDSLKNFGEQRSPVSTSPVSTFSSVVNARLPDETVWKSSLYADKESQLMLDLISNPSPIKKVNLEKLRQVLGSNALRAHCNGKGNADPQGTHPR